MSEFSDSSENYHSIITNMLTFKKQWSQVPEVIYLTIKAIHNHSEQLEENIYRQREIITEHSVKLKEMQFQLDTLAPDLKKQPSFLAATNGQFSKFSKEKKKNLIFSELESQNRTKRSQGSPQNNKQSRSLEKGLDKTMVEEVKALAEAIIDKNSKRANLQLSQLKQELNNQTRELKQVAGRQEELSQAINHQLEGKLNEVEGKINKKIQQQRSSVMTFAEESAMEIEKILIQINNINLRLSQMTEKQIIYPESNILKSKQSSDLQSQSVNESKFIDKLGSLSKDYGEFKIKLMRQMTHFMKSQAVESIVTKFQAESVDKVNKLSQDIKNLTKLVQSQSKAGLYKSQSRVVVPELLEQQQRKKDKNSHKSLALIQQSLQNLEGHFKQKLKAVKKQLLAEMSTRIQREQIITKKQIRQEIQEREKTLCDIVQSNCEMIKNQDRQNSPQDWPFKKAVQNLSQQMVLCRYLHLGQRNCKDLIEWDRVACNLMEENYVWKSSSHMVVVMAAGLYKVETGLYADEEGDLIEAYIVLNGVPICQLKNKDPPPYCKAPARGSLFSEALLLPAKSKIWIKTELPFFGQGYLQILKL